MAKREKNWVAMVIILLLGIILGTLIGELLSSSVPFLAEGVTLKANLNQLGFAKALQLGDVFSLAVGFKLKLTVATLIGLIISYFVYRKF